MDTATDFYFLNEEVAFRINPFSEGEYLVIQTHPRTQGLKVSKRSFNYDDAKRYCEFEKLSHDYATFELRIFHDGNLWTVNALGNRGRISLQQDWKIAPEYVAAIHNNDNNGEIIVCFCSYPYFYEMTCQISGNGEVVECCRCVTCLVDDRKREIDFCPNCEISLTDELDDSADDFYEQITQPAVCIGCTNYHREKYGGDELICAIHPYGWDGVSCPDFTNSLNDYRSMLEMVKVIQPNVEIIKHSGNKITLRGKFISRTGTDDLEYFTEWRLQSASMRNEE
jgi:hypothetical protein